jgi:transposase
MAKVIFELNADVSIEEAEEWLDRVIRSKAGEKKIIDAFVEPITRKICPHCGKITKEKKVFFCCESCQRIF